MLFGSWGPFRETMVYKILLKEIQRMLSGGYIIIVLKYVMCQLHGYSPEPLKFTGMCFGGVTYTWGFTLVYS